jgi:hypothetical protein
MKELTTQADRRRANAQLSTGPRTRSGKAAVAKNAVRHGVLSLAPVVTDLEREEDWQRHFQATCESLQPVGHVELVFAERIALLLWRQARVTRYEHHLLNHAQQGVRDLIGTKNRMAISNYSQSLLQSTYPDDLEYEHGAARVVVRILSSVTGIANDASVDPNDAAIFLMVLARYAKIEIEDVLTFEDWLHDEESEFSEWCLRVPWTGSRLRDAIRMIAEGAGVVADDFLRSAGYRAEGDERGARARWEGTQEEMQRMRESCLVPDEMTMGKISRYESTIERSLTRAMRDLDRMQARRLGMALAPNGENE